MTCLKAKPPTTKKSTSNCAGPTLVPASCLNPAAIGDERLIVTALGGGECTDQYACSPSLISSMIKEGGAAVTGHDMKAWTECIAPCNAYFAE